MPRGFRTRKPKEPKAPVTYEESDVVRTVAERLIRLYPTRFGWTTNFKIGYVFERGSRPRADAKLDFAARFVKVPPLWHGLRGFDAVVLVKVWFWEGYPPLAFAPLNAEQQEALIAHELCHGEMTEKGTLRVVPHDLEEFRFVVGQWGPWDNRVREFGEQLTAFDRNGPAFRTPRTDQATLPELSLTEAAVELVRDLRAKVREADALPDPDALTCEGNVHVPGCAHLSTPTPIRGRPRRNSGQPPAPLS